MNNEEIDFLVLGIESRMSNIANSLTEQAHKPDDHLKVTRLIELLGEASGEMAFIREQLLKNKKPIRKFALVLK